MRQVRRVRQVPSGLPRRSSRPWRARAKAGALALALALSVPVSAQGIRSGQTKTGIAYDIQGRGPVVVLITGSNLDRRMWAHEAAWLAADHTVLRYDLRAHGQSSVPVEPFSHPGDLFALLDELDIRKASLIGLSAGASTALDAALDAPDRFDRIVLAGPGISGHIPKETPAFFGDLMAALKAGDYKKASDVLLATPIFAAPPDAQALVRQMVTENDRLWTVPREMVKPPARPAANRLESLKVPTLVLVGDKDMPQIREQADLLAKRVPGARLVVVPGGGHLLNLTSPKEFRTAVSQFLQ